MSRLPPWPQAVVMSIAENQSPIQRRPAGKRARPTWLRAVPSNESAPDDTARTPVRNAPTFEDVVLAHRTALLAYVTKLTGGDAGRAEDVVQETFFRAWRRFDQLQCGQGTLFGWLARVAHNIVVDQSRARRCRPWEVDADAAPPTLEADRSEWVLTNRLVVDTVAQLAPAHRQALAATYLRDRTAREAAAALGIPVGTVKSRVHYALRQLRDVLDDEALAS